MEDVHMAMTFYLPQFHISLKGPFHHLLNFFRPPVPVTAWGSLSGGPWRESMATIRLCCQGSTKLINPIRIRLWLLFTISAGG